MNVVKIDEHIYEFGKVPKEEYLEYFHYKNPVKLSENTYQVDVLGERLPAVTVIEKDAPDLVNRQGLELKDMDFTNFDDQLAFCQKLFEEVMSSMRRIKLQNDEKLNTYHEFLQERGILEAYQEKYGSISTSMETVMGKKENSIEEQKIEMQEDITFADKEAGRIKTRMPDGEPYDMTQRKLDKLMGENAGVFEFENVRFSEVTFEKIHGRIVQMKNCQFFECKLEGFSGVGIDLTASVFTDCEFINADLKDSKMTESALYYCRFQNSSLERADLTGASVRHTSFEETVLTEAILIRAGMDTVDFRNAIVENAPVGLGTVHFTMGGATQDELENMKQQAYHALNRGENAVDIMHADCRYVRVDGQEGTWSVISKESIGNDSIYLLENEKNRDGTNKLIVDAKGHLLMEHVLHGFTNYFKTIQTDINSEEVRMESKAEKAPEEQHKQKKIGMKR